MALSYPVVNVIPVAEFLRANMQMLSPQIWILKRRSALMTFERSRGWLICRRMRVNVRCLSLRVLNICPQRQLMLYSKHWRNRHLEWSGFYYPLKNYDSCLLLFHDVRDGN